MSQQAHEIDKRDLTFHSKAHFLPKLRELRQSSTSLRTNASWKEAYKDSEIRFSSNSKVSLYPSECRSLIESTQEFIQSALSTDILSEKKNNRIHSARKSIFSIKGKTGTDTTQRGIEKSLYSNDVPKLRSNRLQGTDKVEEESKTNMVISSVHADNWKGETKSNMDSYISDGCSISCDGENPDISLVDSKSVFPLQISLFPNVPPCFHFTFEEPVMKLPKKISETLKWKLTTLTPTLIRETVERSGFKLIKSDGFWTSTWGRHIHCHQFRLIKENQKVNHFPGTFHLGRKDRLWLNIVRMQGIHGKQPFSFMPQTFILPQQTKQLENAWAETGRSCKWIVKPPASARGIGVSVIHRWSDVPQTEPVIVQKYISHPYLINGTKFDLRLYVLATSFDPLRLYVFDDGLVRFASVKYSRSIKDLGEKFIHLTNYSINRTNSCYTSNEDENERQGHKWSLKSLWAYFRENNIEEKKVWSSLIDVVIKTVISCEDPINRLIRIYAKNRYNCYELFGFDIMLDDTLIPWLLEVNITPSLHSNSQLDEKIKAQLIKDTLNTVGIHIPHPVHLASESQLEFLKKAGIHSQKSMFWSHTFYRFANSGDERGKKGWNPFSILKDLSPDDVRQLVQSEDELARCGNFIRIFPSQASSSYLDYFETPKYYNLLLDAWEIKYHDKRQSGIELLRGLCKQRYHLRDTNSQDDISIMFQSRSTESQLSFKTRSNNSNRGKKTKTKKLFSSSLFPLHLFSNQPGEI